MPEPVSRSIGSGFASPAYPVIANNPAFKVAIIPLDNRMEQSNNAKPDNKEAGKIKTGDMIAGEVMGGSKEKAEHVEGRVVAIDQEDETILAIKIVTTDGKEVKVDPTTATKVNIYLPDFAKQPGTAYENRLLTYTEFVAESKNVKGIIPS